MPRKRFIRDNIHTIEKLYPVVKIVYGPYLNKDGRYRVVMSVGKSSYTRQYCKIKMEVKLERRLHPNKETIDHIDTNFRNDRYSNLQILSRAQHGAIDAKRLKHRKGKCRQCGKVFKLSIRQFKPRQDRPNHAGPFCSRRCSGIYGAKIRSTGNVLNYKETKKRIRD